MNAASCKLIVSRTLKLGYEYDKWFAIFLAFLFLNIPVALMQANRRR